jgi:hypothetical protein
MLSLMEYNQERSRVQTAANTLIGLAMTMDDDDYSTVLRTMNSIIGYSNDSWRREIASNVLIMIKNIHRD